MVDPRLEHPGWGPARGASRPPRPAPRQTCLDADRVDHAAWCRPSPRALHSEIDHLARKHSPNSHPLPSPHVSTLAALAAFPAAALSVWALLHSPIAARLVAAPSADRWRARATGRQRA